MTKTTIYFLLYTTLLGGANGAWASTVTVTAGTTYQTISGFGAASVWVESKVTAALAQQFWTDDSSLPPASQVNGNVGLSILRIYINDTGNASGFTTAINSA
jgi:O-glycosyl hydrolase